jgi:DNA-binding NarL/FixJ family response regulator
MVHCARDRLLEILATRAAEMRGVPPAERRLFVTEHVSEWRRTLAREYAGDTVRLRVTTEKRLLDNRHQRDQQIVRLAHEGVPTRSIAERLGVSMRLVQLVVRKAPA